MKKYLYITACILLAACHNDKEEHAFVERYKATFQDKNNSYTEDQETAEAHLAYNAMKFCSAILSNDKKNSLYYAKRAIKYGSSTGDSSIPREWKQIYHIVEVDSADRLKEWAAKLHDNMALVLKEWAKEDEINSSPTKRLEYSVAYDQVQQYEIAARQGDRMQMYTQASLCATAYLQAKDEPEYNYWKHIEDSLGATMGIPRY